MSCDVYPAVYLMASRLCGTLYVGVTSDLVQRIAQHRSGSFGGFTAEYGVKMLFWFEQHSATGMRSYGRNGSRNGGEPGRSN